MEQLSVDFAKKRRKGKLPSEATEALKSWWEANIDNPYPTVRLSKVSSRFPTVPDALRHLTLCPPSIVVDLENHLGHDSKWLHQPAHQVPPIACCCYPPAHSEKLTAALLAVPRHPLSPCTLLLPWICAGVCQEAPAAADRPGHDSAEQLVYQPEEEALVRTQCRGVEGRGGRMGRLE